MHKIARNASLPSFATILLSFTILATVSYVNNGYHTEMGQGIDINHHIWFSKYIVDRGRFPHDNAYEYMPLALITAPILSLVNGMYHPIYILLRTFVSQLIYIVTIWLIVRKRVCQRFSCSLILMLAAFPISMAFYPFFLTLNHVIVLITLLGYIVIRDLGGDSRFTPSKYILYIVLYIASLLSNFSYALIFLALFIVPLYVSKAFSNKKIFKVDSDTSKLLFLSIALTLTYVIYVIVYENTSFGFSIKRSLSAILTLISLGSIELPLKKTQIAVDYTTSIVAFIEVHGTLLVSYALTLLFTVISLLKGRKLSLLHISVLLSLFLVTLLIFSIGYDAFRVVNVANLLLPLAAYLALNSTGNSSSRVIVRVLVSALLLVGFTLLVIIQFTPIGFKATYYEITLSLGNTIVTERIPITEYTARKPVVYVNTLEYFSNRLEALPPYIIGDRTFCHGFMYVHRRDLYLRCRSLSTALDIIINGTEIKGYKFGLAKQSVFLVINYPVKFATEEPVEYRSNIIRESLILNFNTIYNSGATVVCLTCT